MPFAVQLFFDENTEKIIKSAWKDLADAGIAPYMHQSANRPHFTLAIYQQLDLGECERQLKSFAATGNRLRVSFQYFAVFPTQEAKVTWGVGDILESSRRKILVIMLPSHYAYWQRIYGRKLYDTEQLQVAASRTISWRSCILVSARISK